MNWTKEQEYAINTLDKSLLVSAGAGSGKTAVLTQRIINLILNNKTSIDEILVITFTRAAANQMRSKIRKAMQKELRKNKEMHEIFLEQISALEIADISTIDSFCSKIVREYYYILGIDPNYKIIDENEGKIIFNEVISNIFEKYYLSNDLDFINLIDCYSKNKDGEDFKETIYKIYNFIYNRPYPFKWLKEKVEFYNNLTFNEYKESQAYNTIKQKIIDLLEDSIVSAHESLIIVQKYEKEIKLKDILETDLAELKRGLKLAKEDLDKYAKEKITFRTFYSTKDFDINIKNEIKDIKRKNIKDNIKKTKELLGFSDIENFKFLKEISMYANKIEEILKEADKEFKKYKNQNASFEFKDIEHFTIDILNNDASRNQIKEKYKYVFVDEYQDTNLVQEEIVNFIAKENNLFTVGDLKQSIYRFRLAEPLLFSNRLKNYSKETNTNNEVIYLNKNFRSNMTTINIINHIFSNIMSEKIGDVNYLENDKLLAGRENTGNCKLDIHLINQFGKTENSDFKKAEQIECEYIAKLINSLLNEEIYDKNTKKTRKIQYSDICVLSSKIKGKNKIYKETFAKAGIPLECNGERDYFDLLEVGFIIDFLKIINNEIDDIPLLGVMRGPFFNFETDELLEIKLISPKTNSYYQAIKDYLEISNNNILKEKIKNMFKSIHFWRERSKHISLYDLIEEIYSQTHFLDIISALPSGNVRRENLLFLKEKAKNYENLTLKGLHSFLQFVNNAKQHSFEGMPTIEKGDNGCVTLSSIHKSKGLEYPIIILADSTKQLSTSNTDSILMDKDLGICPDYINLKENYKVNTLMKKAALIRKKEEELSEKMRLFYVALTRAEERIIITGVSKDWEKIINKLPNKMSILNIEKNSSFIEWAMMCALKNNKEYISFDKDILFENNYFKIHQDIPKQNKNTKQRRYLKQNNIYVNIEKIKSNWNFDYAYKYEASLPTKLTVSQLKEDNILSIGKEIISIEETPEFMNENNHINNLNKGTLIHLILEKIDLDEIKTNNDRKATISREINKLIKKQYITQHEIENLNLEMIYNFFESNIGNELLCSNKIVREKPFNIKIPSREIMQKWEYAKEDILVQGIIDCYFENEDGSVTIIDFKTDYIPNDNKEIELVKYYTPQLNYYEKALKEIAGKIVRKKIIYFLNKNKAVEII